MYIECTVVWEQVMDFQYSRHEKGRAMEMWRIMMKINWAERKSNKEVLNTVQEPRQINKMIETRRIKFIGHQQHNKFIIIIIEGKINGKEKEDDREIRISEKYKKQLSQISYEEAKKQKLSQWQDEAFR